MKTKLLIASFALLVLMVALAIRATVQLREAKTATAALASEGNQLRETTDRMEVRLQTAKMALMELQPVSATPPELTAGAIPSVRASYADGEMPAKSPPLRRRLSPHSIVANDPAKMAIYARNLRASVECNYGGMFKALRLSPEQIEKFKDAEVWLEEMRMDLIAAIESQGLTPDSAEYKKLWADYNNVRGPKKAEVLGDLTERYMEYFWTNSVRWYPQQLAWTGVFTGETVTSAQVEQAADILSANSKRRGEAPTKHGVEWSTLDWAAASKQLKSLLSPGQIEMLGGMIERDKLQFKVGQRTNQLTAQFKAANSRK